MTDPDRERTGFEDMTVDGRQVDGGVFDDATLSDPELQELAGELRAIGQAWTPKPAATLGHRVLAEIEHPATTGTARFRRWRRWLLAIAAMLAALAVTAALSAPVRAAIAEVFRFGGVEVRSGAGPSPAASPSLPGNHPADIAAASRQAGFPVRTPSALGTPSQITVTPSGVVSLEYRTSNGPVRLDEFRADLGPMFEKYLAVGAAQKVAVGADDGYWFDDPTVTIYLGPAGPDAGSARTTNGTLLWVAQGITYRLDGVRPLPAALAVAATLG